MKAEAGIPPKVCAPPAFSAYGTLQITRALLRVSCRLKTEPACILKNGAQSIAISKFLLIFSKTTANAGRPH
jgi:hypothetical protein